MSWILLTNDDGIDATSLQDLVSALHDRGYKCVVFAPSENNSAVSMKISLGKPLTVTRVEDPRENVHQFSIGGTPCDCIIAALDGGLQKLVPGVMPKLVVSGINLGPNLSQDAYHSGTIAAAREAGMYGMPAIASSWSSFDPEGMEIAIEATIQLIEAALAVLPDTPANLNRPHIDVNAPHLTSWPKKSPESWSENPVQALRDAFAAGEILLNLNVPRNWTGKYSATRLGMRWYRNAITFSNDTSTFQLGAASIDVDAVDRGDVDSDELGIASVTCMPSWPQTHPLEADVDLLAWSLINSTEGMPIWL
ncbi:MAG: hypothetical protein H2066_04775 [Candidatus Poseidoniales archaeon]|nr:hypothetical protein [Candidatus Poseidoniales archaeon]